MPDRPRPDRRRHAAAAAVLAVSLAGCQAPPPAGFSELTYGHLEPIRLAAAEIAIVDRFEPPLRPPHVEHRMPVTPAAAAARWAAARLRADGAGGHLVFTILDAAVVETRLQRTGGIAGVFTIDQAERHDATLAVALELFDRAGQRVGGVSSTVRRSRTMPEDVTIAGRERIWFEMTEALVADLDSELSAGIREHLFRHLR